MIILRMLLCMMRKRCFLFWWAALGVAYAIFKMLFVDLTQVQMLSHSVAILIGLGLMAYEVYEELLRVRAEKFKGPRF